MTKETNNLKKLSDKQMQIMRSLAQIMSSLDGFSVEDAVGILCACLTNLLEYAINKEDISEDEACEVLDAAVVGIKVCIKNKPKVPNLGFEVSQ